MFRREHPLSPSNAHLFIWGLILAQPNVFFENSLRQQTDRQLNFYIFRLGPTPTPTLQPTPTGNLVIVLFCFCITPSWSIKSEIIYFCCFSIYCMHLHLAWHANGILRDYKIQLIWGILKCYRFCKTLTSSVRFPQWLQLHQRSNYTARSLG